MLVDFLQLALGLLLLVVGGEFMVRGGSALARQLGVSPMAIGLTVLAFGTSAPELAVNVTAAWRGNGEMSFGNIFGSNMANIGLILAITALIQPLEIKSMIIRREVPMMLLATAVAAVLCLDGLITGEISRFDRSDGIVLLLLFTVFVYYTVNDVLLQREASLNGARELGDAAVPRVSGLGMILLLTGAGLVGLLIGAGVTVNAAVGLARAFNVSEAIIGLTMVAVGTSLPELTASLVAIRKGHVDLAVGNVVGSNIFNLLPILGVSSLIRPIPVPEGGAADVAVVGGLSMLLWITSLSAGRTIIRAEAVLLLLVYLGYLTYRAF